MWSVIFCDEFAEEFQQLNPSIQETIAFSIELLIKFGPHLSRPYADTLYGSRYTNMKELRCEADGGIWRIAFAFDPKRCAILLTVGNKIGANQKRFYKKLVTTADQRFTKYLDEQGER
jgi:hypothetical protein